MAATAAAAAATIQPNQTGTTTHLPSGQKSWYTTPNPFENQFGYHRAIRRGPFIFVSGTTALKEVHDPSPRSSISNTGTTPPPAPLPAPAITAAPYQQQYHKSTDQGTTPWYRLHKKSIQYNETELAAATAAASVVAPTPPSMSPQTHPFLAERESRSRVHHPTSAKLQAQIAMERCVDAVEKLGGKREDVVRVKMFVAHHSDCNNVGAAFRDCFGSKKQTGTEGKGIDEVGAAATMIVVQNGFVDADILVEVEIDAVVV